jgi:hypothetical protein
MQLAPSHFLQCLNELHSNHSWFMVTEQVISDYSQFSCQGTLPSFYIKCTICSSIIIFMSGEFLLVFYHILPVAMS